MSDKMQIIIDVESGKAVTKIKNLKDELDGVEKKSKKAASSTDTLSQSFGNVAMEAAKGVAALAAIGSVISTSIKSVNEYQSAMTGLASIARYAGESVDGTLNAALSLSADGLMTNAEAALALKNLLMRGFGLTEATAMINRFKDSAAFGRQASLGFGEAIVGATEGLKNENSMLIDNAGVTKNVSVMWKEYAQQLGVGEKSLTMAQKRQAEYNGIMRETEGQIGNAELASQGLIGAQAKLNQKFKDNSRAIGEALTPALISMSNIGGEAIDNFIKPMIFAFEKLGADIGYGATVVGVFYDSIVNLEFSSVERRLDSLKKTHEEMLVQLAKEIDIGKSPTIGADSGARRKDINAPTSKNDNKVNEELLARQKELDNQKTALAMQSAQERFNALSLIAQTAGDDEETQAIDAFQQKMDRMEVEKEFLIQHGASRVELERQADENRLLLAADLENQILGIRKKSQDKELQDAIRQKKSLADIEQGAWSFMGSIAQIGGEKSVKAYEKVVLAKAALSAASSAISAWSSGMAQGGWYGAIAAEAANWAHVAGLMANLGSSSSGGGGSTSLATPTQPASTNVNTVDSQSSQPTQTDFKFTIDFLNNGVDNMSPADLARLGESLAAPIQNAINNGSGGAATV